VATERRSYLAKLVRTLLILPALLGGFSASEAAASTGLDLDIDAPRETATSANPSADAFPLLRLAQSGEVEIYIDEYGRRVIVDSYTGEVLGVQRPRAYRNRTEYRRMLRRRELNRDPDFGYVNPDGIPYKPRPYYRGRPLNEYPDDSLGPVPAPDYAYPEAPQDVFPEAPDAYPSEPEVMAREPVERSPLETEPGGQETSPDSSPEPLDGTKQPAVTFGARDDVAALQVLLDRKGASPGVIDGHFGGNVDKALASYRDITGDNLHSTDSAKIKADLAASGGDTFTSYTITPEDAAGPYVASVPADYGQKAKLDRLSYTSVPEMLAERFHMDENYLKALNPNAVFGRPGTVIKVVNIGKEIATPVTRIVADKSQKQVRAYDAAGKLVVAYPATIGSADTPSPSGTHEVSRVAFNPEYTYNPNLNFKQGDNNRILTIPPGPNNPVGSIWIALDKPTYGIHGTPDPSKIGKTESHGCVRLTNWDANELAKLVKPGVTVEFRD
jgi:lipoprotein-anchoring transpeptidase ErfK/SrfK